MNCMPTDCQGKPTKHQGEPAMPTKIDSSHHDTWIPFVALWKYPLDKK